MIDVRQTPVVGHPQIAPPDCGELGESARRSLRGRAPPLDPAALQRSRAAAHPPVTPSGPLEPGETDPVLGGQYEAPPNGAPATPAPPGSVERLRSTARGGLARRA